jgi:tetratricopeptide (TPR) repeat protein
MRRIISVILLAACLWPAGCQWVGLRDPVPASLARSRKLSSEGNELLEQKRPDLAEEKLAEAVKTCPTDCDARRYYAEALWLRNARPQAVAQLEEACRLGPDSDLRVRLAEMYLEMGQLEQAGESVDQILNRNSKLAAAWRVRGCVSRAMGDRLMASRWEKAISICVAGDAPPGEVDRVLAARTLDQARPYYLQALADLHRAAGYDPSDRLVIGETAAVYRSLGQPQRALETMQGLLDTYAAGEEPPQLVLYWTGLDYMALQRYDDAVASFTTAVSQGRPTPQLLYSLGEAQYRNGRSQEAVAALQRALAVDPDPQHSPSQQLLHEIQVAQQGRPVMQR